MWRTWPLFLIVFLSGCPKPAAPLIPSASARVTVSAEELAGLTIPPSPGSLETLAKLEEQADDGEAPAAWHRAHYLLDLFDSVRFGGDEESRKALAAIAGRPLGAMHGSAATQAIAELILLEIDHVLELDRGHSLAQQARSLILFDASPPVKRAEVFQRVEELRRIVAKESPLGTAARLRLFGYCREALLDADTLGGTQRRVALSHCLYPLYTSDPAPYFADQAEERPPAPAQAELLIDLQALLTHSAWARLSSSVALQLAWLKEFSQSSSAETALDPMLLRLPPGEHVSPYDDYPLLGAKRGEVEAERANLRRALANDTRRVVALPFASEAPASATLEAAALAASAGASSVAVLVSMRQRLSIPKGDYGSARLQDGQATRAGEIHLSLALLTDEKRDAGTNEAKATAWDPRRAALRLHLVVSPKEWRLTSPQGDIQLISSSTQEIHPRELLRTLLSEIRRAFPDEDGLVLVPEGGTSHGALVAAALAARMDAKGKSLFSHLAIARTAPRKRSGKTLYKQMQRRAAAAVSVIPTSLETRTPVALRCYQELHNKRRAPVGEIRLELDAEGLVQSSGRGESLASCAKKAYAGAMLDDKIPSIVVRFSARGK